MKIDKPIISDFTLSPHDHTTAAMGGLTSELAETASRSIYVATNGSDVTGDGTIGNPFASWLKAYQNIKTVINPNVAITIDVAAGAYTVDMNEIVKVFRKLIFLSKSSLIVSGKFQADFTGLTLAAHSPEAYIYDVTGATFTANQVQDKFLYDGSVYYPIASNGVSTINSAASAAATIIRSNTVYVTLVGGNFSYVNPYIDKAPTFEFDNINWISASAIAFENTYILDMIGCKFTAPSVSFDKSNFRNNLQGCAFVLSTGGLTFNGNDYQMNACIRKSGSKAGTALSVTSAYVKGSLVRGGGIYMVNWATGIAAQQGNFNFNIANSMVVFDNVTTAITIRNNTNMLFSSLSPVYLTTVGTFLSNGETMSFSYRLFVSSLTGTPTTLVAANAFVNGLVNTSKDVYINIPGMETSGKAILVGGTVTVSTPAVQAGSLILLTRTLVGGILGELSIGTIVAGTSFVINSVSGAETSTITWQIIGQ
jgi:hypothetical protein